MPTDRTMDNILHINVAGKTFQTFQSTLKRSKSKVLKDLTSLNEADLALTGCKQLSDDEFFFDRNPKLFAYILDFGRTDKLHVPRDVCVQAVRDELNFWGLDETHVASCCSNIIQLVNKSDTDEKAVQERNPAAENTCVSKVPEVENWVESGKNSLKYRMWRGMEYPFESTGGKIFITVSTLVTLIAILVQSVQTLPQVRSRDWQMTHHMVTHYNMTVDRVIKSRKLYMLTTHTHGFLMILETVLFLYFLLEYIVRLIVWPSKKSFFRSIMNCGELVYLLPMIYIFIVFAALGMNMGGNTALGLSVYVAICLASLRVLKIFQFARHFKSFKAIGQAFRESYREIFLLMLLMVSIVPLFATALYVSEMFKDDSKITSIPIGIWYTFVTMATVGYGDVYPTSFVGYILGSGAAMVGILFLALPISIISNKFQAIVVKQRIEQAEEEKRRADEEAETRPMSKLNILKISAVFQE